MGSLLTTLDIIERVEQMLDALFVPNLSAKESVDGCAVLEAFLATHGDSLSQAGKLDDAGSGRVLAVLRALINCKNALPLKRRCPANCKNILPITTIDRHNKITKLFNGFL